MGINFFELKQRAKAVMRESNPSLITLGMLLLVVQTLSDSIRVYSTGANHVYDREFMNYINEGNVEFANAYINQYLKLTPSVAGGAVLLNLVCSIISVGFIFCIIRTVRKLPVTVGDMMHGFTLVLKVIGLELLEGLLIALASLALIVPGFILAYRYRLAIYLLLDKPELSIIQCLKESGRLMSGKKLELFRLDLSFLPWILLGGLGTIGIATRIWSLPLMETSYELYYEVAIAQDGMSLPPESEQL